MKIYKIERVGGKHKSKYGIKLLHLPPIIQKYLKNNKQFQYINSDKDLNILFYLKEKNYSKLHKKKIYICPYTKQPSTLKEIQDNSNKVKFKCFNCSESINSVNNNFSYQNLSCNNCKNIKYNLNDFILYTEKFRLHIKNILEKNQNNLIKYIKNNSKY